jgi:integrase
MASYFKDKSRGGKWTCQYKIPGQKVPGVKRGFDRKKDAEEWFHNSGHSIEAGTIKRAEKLTVSEWMKTWNDTYCAGLQPNTRWAHEIAIDKHITPLIGSVLLAALRPDHVQQMVNALGTKYKPQTVRNTYSYLSSAMRRAVYDRLISQSPCAYITLPQAPAKKPNYCSPEQVQAVIKEMANSIYYMPILFCAMLGLRRGEALGIKWDDISGDRVHIHKQVTTQKGEAVYKDLKNTHSERILSMPKALQEALSIHRIKQKEQKLMAGGTYNDEGFVCAGIGGGFLSPDCMSAMAKRFLSRIGAAPGTHLHDLRHTYATLLYQEGYTIDVVADLLGHSGVVTAMKYYVGENEEKKEKAAEKINELYSEK